MPKGTWDMEDFKRFYSNNDEEKSIPYFWDKFDKENYSIWRCDYKYADELTMVFMSCNLIGGKKFIDFQAYWNLPVVFFFFFSSSSLQGVFCNERSADLVPAKGDL